MGCDIHGIFQKKNDDGSWTDIPSSYDYMRHYRLFSVLAGVRNGIGFAGLRYGSAIEPIDAPRGLPEDFQIDEEQNHKTISFDCFPSWKREYVEKENDLNIWMGDHSFSWLSGDELLYWYQIAPTVACVDILDREMYFSWDKKSVPESYCGDIFGPNVKVIEQNEVDENNMSWTHVRCKWESHLKDELAYFFNEVQKLQDEHGEIRFVFGFDS